MTFLTQLKAYMRDNFFYVFIFLCCFSGTKWLGDWYKTGSIPTMELHMILANIIGSLVGFVIMSAIQVYVERSNPIPEDHQDDN